MAVDEKLSKLVRNQFPDFYKEEGPLFLDFMEAYYGWMEENGNLTDGIKNLKSYRDIATTTDDYIDYFFKELLPSVPVNVQGDKKLMAKYISQFNRSRGTFASYRLLFRAIFNEDIEIYYPADSILKVSDGDWQIDRYLVVPYDPRAYTFIAKTIKGMQSGAEAFVEDVIRRSIRGRDLMQILLSNTKGTFRHLENARLLTDTNATGYTPIVEAGISRIDLTSFGGEYAAGDEVKIISDNVGEFGKVVVTGVVNLGGALSFTIEEGGSGYTPSTEENGTVIQYIGGDATVEGSFDITASDITDLYGIYVNLNYLNSSTLYGAKGPTIDSHQMTTFANVIIGATSYGFPEAAEETTAEGIDYRDHANAVITIANTSDPGIVDGSSLFGITSGANATVTYIKRAYNSANVILGIDGYKNFEADELVNIGTASGTTVGRVVSFQGNTISKHALEIATLSGMALNVDDEIKGTNSGTYGVIKTVGAANNGAYTNPNNPLDVRDVYVYTVAANNSANLTSQFDTGPLTPFQEEEEITIISSSSHSFGDVVGNTIYNTSNAEYENVYTTLNDSLVFKSTRFGTISRLSNRVGGEGYSQAPTIIVRENDIASLGVGEYDLTLQSSDADLLTIDTTDRLVQDGAAGDVKVVNSTITHSNGTYETSIRIWQHINARTSGIEFTTGSATLDHIGVDYDFGVETDARAADSSTSVTITSLTDRGILGDNANITARVGANGTISTVRVVDSGFSYRDGEEIILEASNRTGATGGTGTLTLSGVANAEGYYTSTRSHISTSRGFIQDGEYYQEFSYEIISPVSLNRYRDIALQLAHPAGQRLFGKYRSQSNATLNVSANSYYTKPQTSNGTVGFTSGSFDIAGTGTAFTSEFANNGTMIVEVSAGTFYTIPLNIVSSNTAANSTIAWANSNISGLTAYYK